MNKAVEVLMGEHRRIEQALGSLETFVLAVENGLAPDRALLADYASFFAGYADASHHGKEENVLFARMVERGFSRESGPVAVMLHEHVAGRAHVSVLRQAGDGNDALSAVETQLVVEHAGAFVPHLRAHIQKEDRILYPMALRLLSDEEMNAVGLQFERQDAACRADGTHDRLEALCDRLVSFFRPDPVRMAVAANLVTCGR